MKKSVYLMMILLAFACQKERSVDYEDNPEALSQEDVEALDNLPDANFIDFKTLILPNGDYIYDFLLENDPDFINSIIESITLKSTSLNNPFEGMGRQKIRNLILSRMTAVSHVLVNRSLFQYQEEGAEKPAQNGIAYSWGSKDYSKRQKPPGSKSYCTHKIHGLDCSGFVYQVFKSAGINLLSGPANLQRDPETLKNAILASIPAFEQIKVEDLGSISSSDFEAGDIIYWLKGTKASHIGIILKNDSGGLGVYQCNGSPGNSEEDCSKNLGTTRGTRVIELNDPYWFGSSKPYGITRIDAEISGTWHLQLRCQGQSVNALELMLDFSTNTEESTISISGTGTDYDGGLINCEVNATFDVNKNVLKATIKMTKPSHPEFYRYDSFEVEVNDDETDFFPLTLGDNQYAGCSVEGKLINEDVYNNSKLLQNHTGTTKLFLK